MSENPYSNITDPYGYSLNTFVVDGFTGEASLIQIKNRMDPSVYRGTEASYQTGIANSQQFREIGWASSAQPANKDEEVVLQFRFDQDRTFNRLSFELSNVPQYFSVYYFDFNRKSMVILKDNNGTPVQGYISGDKANVEGPGVAWIKEQYAVPATQTNLLEIRVRRNPARMIDLGLSSRTPFKIRLRRFYLRFHVVPPVTSPIDSIPDPSNDKGIDETITLPPEEDLGQYKLINFSAVEALNASNNSFWHSPPLGPGSVYPFIVDLRNSDGDGQIFDTIKMIPLYTGSLMNVYTSNDETIGTFKVSSNKSVLTLNNNEDVDNIKKTTVTDNDWIDKVGIILRDDRYWTISNEQIRLNTFNSFSLGLQLESSEFTNSIYRILTLQGNALHNLRLSFNGVTTITQSSEVDIEAAECSDFQANFLIPGHSFTTGNYLKVNGISLAQYNGVWKILSTTTDSVTVSINKFALASISDESSIGKARTANQTSGSLELSIGNDSIVIDSTKFVETYKYGIGFGFDKSKNTWYLFKALMDSKDIELATSDDIPYVGEFVNQLILGNSADSFKGILSNLWIKQDAFSENVVQFFLRNTNNFIQGLGNKNHKLNGHFNTLLLAPFLNSLEYKFGPNRAYYDAKQWKPVNRDFILNTDTYKLGTSVKAKFVKLEFSKPVDRYYNPATLETTYLPIYSYPARIRKWFFENNQFASRTGSFIYSNVTFDSPRPITGTQNMYGLINIKSALEGSNTSSIFNADQIGIDFLLDSNSWDSYALSQQIKNSSIHMRFPLTGQHDYQVTYLPMKYKRAYFYGIQSLKFLRTDQTTSFNNKTYFSLAPDTTWIESPSPFPDTTPDAAKFTSTDDYFVADKAGASITTKTFKSFNTFKSLQLGILSSPMKDLLSQGQINLSTVAHISTINITNSNSGVPEVISNVRGSSDGKTLWLRRTNYGQYGIATDEINLPSDTASAVTSGINLVAACRLRSLSINPKSVYELQLQVYSNSSWKTAASKKIKPNAQYSWSEHELVYSTQPSETKFRLKLIQTDFSSTEEIYLDMLGLWMSPIKWEIVDKFNLNNTPAHYSPIVFNLSNPIGLISIPETDKLKLKITAVTPDAWFSGWTAIPHYTNVPINLSAYIFKQFDWAVSDSPENRIASRQIFFSEDSAKMLPKRYSIYNDVIGSRVVY